MNAPQALGPWVESQKLARGIMGKNFLGREEVRRGYGIAFTDAQLDALGRIPYSEETLIASRDTHVLVAGAPLSLTEIRERAGGNFSAKDWYTPEPFANEKQVGVRWHLLRKELVPGSLGKAYGEQCLLLTKEEEVPFACEMAYMVILYWLTHRERLLPDLYVRCRDQIAQGNSIDVGGFDARGFHIDSGWDGGRHNFLGLASSVSPRMT